MNKILIWALGILTLIVIGVFAFFMLATEDEGPVAITESNYDCESNIYNCDDFGIRSEAQKVFDECGGLENDVHALDKDGNGLACEGLPS